MKKTALFWVAAVAATSLWAGPFDRAELRGVTDKNPVSYAIGELIDFTLTLSNADVPENGTYFVQWTRTGDDGKKESGKVPVVKDLSFHIGTILEKPGFVRIEAKLVDEKGQDVKRDCPAPGENWFGTREVFFSGGAAADLSKLRQGVEEPEDFDAFWEKQKAELRCVPMKVKRWEVKSPKESVRMYGVQIDCAGGRPVTGYLSIPKRCDTGMKLPARIAFDGYGTGIQRVPKQCWFDWQINFHINAHGYDLERDDDYYKQFFASIKRGGKGYAFNTEDNMNPETAYFRGMALRVLRALEYLESLPEWNGKEILAEGGSQGGLQAVWAAALDHRVTKVNPNIIWCCDIGKQGDGRLRSEFEPAFAPGLRYYDCVNMARRIAGEVHVTRAGLGDYTSPPSGITLFFNHLDKAKKKRITFVQGSRHGYIPPKPDQHDLKE
ncbi:MAG: acetylxylan esterase [Kiritimatiellia bacterium]